MSIFQKETEDHPKMFQVYLNKAWHEVFCYALAYEDEGRHEDKLLLTIVSGSDSALQSVKGAIDIGSRGGLKFGYGIKELKGYQFHWEKHLFAEKGKYESFPMTLNRNRKAYAIVHEDILNNTKFVISFDGHPAHDVALLLGGPQYGLHILPEWEETVLHELIRRGHLVEHHLYYDRNLFPNGLYLYSINLTEEEADLFIESLIRDGLIRFPKEGTGEELENIDNLTDYLLQYSEAMVQALSMEVTPTHNPLKDPALKHFDSYPKVPFPVQSHVATAIVKRLFKQKAVIIQGEMSTGKSLIMTAVADGFHHLKGKTGYHVCLMCPPSLTKKWPNEIKEVLPHAKVHVIQHSEELIRYHAEWVRQGKPKPKVPTFFIISFTTMRGDARIVPAVNFIDKRTSQQKIADEEDAKPYRFGYYCPHCGKPHQTVESILTEIDEDGNEIEIPVTHSMTPGEFGDTRRILSMHKPANAFCFHCGESLWTRKVPTRYASFGEWAKFDNQIQHAIRQNNPALVKHLTMTQPPIKKVVGMPRRIAAIEYIRRKMKNFFDISIVDELHELKGGATAQGNSLASLFAVSKKVVAGTGTLFGGYAQDIYYLLWRLFPNEMVKSGFKFRELGRFNEEYGIVEETSYEFGSEHTEYSNTNSRGGRSGTRKKVLPGISPFIYGKYLIQNVVNVRLADVWPDPVELVDTPTIFVPMTEELHSHYRGMISAFEYAIDNREDGHKLYLPLTDYGVAYPDNPFTFPDATIKNLDGTHDVIWKATHLDPDCTLPKEKKLQEIIQGEMAEGRKCIVYVRDTGSSVAERDLRPRLKKKLEEIGAKTCILDTSTTATNNRSEWLHKKITKEGYDVCIVSQELVKVGLDLLCTPTLIYYQFSWSLYTINQSSRRAWRIGQTQECRIFYLAYADSYQQKMAELIAKKNRATAAINGEVSTDGLSAMLGDEGDLQSLLIENIKKGEDVLKGTAEEWINQASERAREILANIGKKKQKLSILEQFVTWVEKEIKGETTKQAMLRDKELIIENIKAGRCTGFQISGDVLAIDLVDAFGFDRDFVSDGAILYHLLKPDTPLSKNEKPKVVQKTKEQKESKLIQFTSTKSKKRNKKSMAIEGQLAFELF